jgi:hypothetical protein
VSRRDPYDEINAEALRAAAREAYGTLGQWRAEGYPTVAEMIREQYPPASGMHRGRPGKANPRRGL